MFVNRLRWKMLLWLVICHVSQIDSFRGSKWFLAAFIDEAGGLACESSETLNLSS